MIKKSLIALLVVSMLSMGFCTSAENGELKEVENATATPVREDMNILETAWAMSAWNMGNFSTLVAGAWAANLTETLTGEENFTIFAPTDEAFYAMPGGRSSFSSIANVPETVDSLAASLKYHVVPGKFLSTDLEDGMTLETLLGETLTVKVTDEGVAVIAVDEAANLTQVANVTLADMECSNGVIHVIDTVLIPPGTVIGVMTGEVTDEGEINTTFEVIWPPQEADESM
jgi:uncharacterized surface protein with fasciclin (FAS1) repeats